MTGFCKDCGLPRKDNEKCPCGATGTESSSHKSILPQTSSASALAVDGGIGPFPKSDTGRRLLGSGIEYFAYVAGAWAITLLDSITGGILGFLAVLLVCLVVLRDFKGGAFSIAKRVSQMRVVDLRTGQAASNAQALLRNGYYLGLLFIAAVLPWIDWLSSALFTMFVVLDIAMIFASRRGRRLGDFLARTQVVGSRS